MQRDGNSYYSYDYFDSVVDDNVVDNNVVDAVNVVDAFNVANVGVDAVNVVDAVYVVDAVNVANVEVDAVNVVVDNECCDYECCDDDLDCGCSDSDAGQYGLMNAGPLDSSTEIDSPLYLRSCSFRGSFHHPFLVLSQM